MNGIILVSISAHLTADMQPLDVYCFAMLKKRSNDAYERIGHIDSEGNVNTVARMKEVFAVAEELLTKTSWKPAFVGCGYGDQQQNVGQRLRRRLSSLHANLEQGSDLPSLSELREVWFSKTGKSNWVAVLFVY